MKLKKISPIERAIAIIRAQRKELVLMEQELAALLPRRERRPSPDAVALTDPRTGEKAPVAVGKKRSRPCRM